MTGRDRNQGPTDFGYSPIPATKLFKKRRLPTPAGVARAPRRAKRLIGVHLYRKGVKGCSPWVASPSGGERGSSSDFQGIAPGERDVTLPDRISLFLKTISGTICYPVFTSCLQNICGGSNGTIPYFFQVFFAKYQR